MRKKTGGGLKLQVILVNYLASFSRYAGFNYFRLVWRLRLNILLQLQFVYKFELIFAIFKKMPRQ